MAINPLWQRRNPSDLRGVANMLHSMDDPYRDAGETLKGIFDDYQKRSKDRKAQELFGKEGYTPESRKMAAEAGVLPQMLNFGKAATGIEDVQAGIAGQRSTTRRAEDTHPSDVLRAEATAQKARADADVAIGTARNDITTSGLKVTGLQRGEKVAEIAETDTEDARLFDARYNTLRMGNPAFDAMGFQEQADYMRREDPNLSTAAFNQSDFGQRKQAFDEGILKVQVDTATAERDHALKVREPAEQKIAMQAAINSPNSSYAAKTEVHGPLLVDSSGEYITQKDAKKSGQYAANEKDTFDLIKSNNALSGMLGLGRGEPGWFSTKESDFDKPLKDQSDTTKRMVSKINALNQFYSINQINQRITDITKFSSDLDPNDLIAYLDEEITNANTSMGNMR